MSDCDYKNLKGEEIHDGDEFTPKQPKVERMIFEEQDDVAATTDPVEDED